MQIKRVLRGNPFTLGPGVASGTFRNIDDQAAQGIIVIIDNTDPATLQQFEITISLNGEALLQNVGGDAFGVRNPGTFIIKQHIPKNAQLDFTVNPKAPGIANISFVFVYTTPELIQGSAFKANPVKYLNAETVRATSLDNTSQQIDSKRLNVNRGVVRQIVFNSDTSGAQALGRANFSLIQDGKKIFDNVPGNLLTNEEPNFQRYFWPVHIDGGSILDWEMENQSGADIDAQYTLYYVSQTGL